MNVPKTVSPLTGGLTQNHTHHFDEQTNPFSTKRQEGKFPDVFADHHAPLSVWHLWREWVVQADNTDNAVITINLRQQTYGHTTVAKAIKWIRTHTKNKDGVPLLVKVESGGGRGVGSWYLVRWSFRWGSLSDRQNAVNHSEIRNTVRLRARVVVRSLDEVPRNKNLSFSRQTDGRTRERLAHDSRKSQKSEVSKAYAGRSENKRLRQEKGVRFAMARFRSVTDDCDILAALAKGIRSLLADGKVFLGPELAYAVGYLKRELRIELAKGDALCRQDKFRYIGTMVHAAGEVVYWNRLLESPEQDDGEEDDFSRVAKSCISRSKAALFN